MTEAQFSSPTGGCGGGEVLHMVRLAYGGCVLGRNNRQRGVL